MKILLTSTSFQDTPGLHNEKLNNLDQLPNYGFKVSAFPFKLKNGSAGFVRVVAIFE